MKRERVGVFLRLHLVEAWIFPVHLPLNSRSAKL